LRPVLPDDDNGKNAIEKGIEMFTFKSAFEDPRFSPITIDEYSGLIIDITLLDPKKKVSYDQYINEYNIGQDGIELKIGQRSAFFLPSVGSDIKKEKPDLTDKQIKLKLLKMLCRKSGLMNEKCYAAENQPQFFINDGFILKHF
jgi:AMMECR1 domain-containing protein